jgi:pimeloyl-ACP methyl ester carboxylesterase
VVTLDLTGHGASPALPPGAGLATLAGDVLATARALALPEPLELIGHSLGGRVALAAGRLAPEALARVSLLDIGPSPGPPGAREIARVLAALLAAPARGPSRGAVRTALAAEGLSGALVDWLLLNLETDGDGVRWRIDRAALADFHRRAGDEDLWGVVEGSRPFALRCARGEGSDYVSGSDAARLTRAGCPVTTVDGAGHFLHVDRPRELLAWVLGD